MTKCVHMRLLCVFFYKRVSLFRITSINIIQQNCIFYKPAMHVLPTPFQTESGRRLVCFLFNDFLLLTKLPKEKQCLDPFNATDDNLLFKLYFEVTN